VPLITATPQPQGVAPLADVFEVTGINIRMAEAAVTIYWRKALKGAGAQQGEIARGAHVEPLSVLAGLFPSGAKTYFQNLKELAYQRLQQAGVFPAAGVLS
jgi:hypothetical protein